MSDIKRRSQIVCPHCGSGALIASTEEVTLITKQLNCICKDPECGHTFVAHLSVVRTLSPSRCPNPNVTLPISNNSLVKKR